MSVALFLQIMQILNAMGGAGVAFINIKKYIDENGLRPEDLLPQSHEAKVRSLLAPAQASDDNWDANHAGE